MTQSLIRLNAPDHVIAAIVDVWREMGRISEMIVYGRSMEPAIQKGAKILVDHRLDPVVVGDVIVFQNADHLTTHRVVEISQQEDGLRLFVTQGDIHSHPDKPVQERQVLGRVVEIRNP